VDPGGWGAMSFLSSPPEDVLCLKNNFKRSRGGGENTEKLRGKWKENREGEKKRKEDSREL